MAQHSVSICATLGRQSSPWKSRSGWGCTKPGSALIMLRLDSSVGSYFITGVNLSASVIPLKPAGLFTSLHLGIFRKYFAESVPGTLSIFFFFNHG